MSLPKLANNLSLDEAHKRANSWFDNRGWEMFEFQKSCIDEYLSGKHGLLNAPTGMGKTYALALPFLLQDVLRPKKRRGLKALWITPLRALSVDIRQAIQDAADELETGWKVERRSGDVSSAKKKAQLSNAPDCLITTPESIHLIMATKGYERFFKHLDVVVVDEWHELLGSKRGAQVELALSRLKAIVPKLQIWGISATIGNMDQAMQVLLGQQAESAVRIVSERKKELEFKTLLPESIDKFPWAGHLGIRLLKDTLPIIKQNTSTILFTNTRSQAEIWYNRLIEECPELIGEIAMHHGSLDKKLRAWVEQALHQGRLKAVVSTSSLDLGVDFRPVSAVIQIGSPKGIARFVQRAGRSGHSPYEKSKVFFLPTNSMEIIEALALKRSIEEGFVESRKPVIRAFDLLIQYMMTLAVSDGFDEKQLFEEVKGTHCYQSLSREEWMQLCQFITQGGESLQAYEEFNKVSIEEGLYKVKDRRIAQRHRLSMGTIVGDTNIKLSYKNGKRIGTVEEYFISRLEIGDCFLFAGQTLELLSVQAFTAYVRPAKAKKVAVPSWQGGRMSLSSEISEVLRQELNGLMNADQSAEHKCLQPMLEIQARLSKIPHSKQLLIERFEDDEGQHVFVYPFEGRMVNEGIALLMAYRISQYKRLTLSVAMNDYGFELLCDQDIPLEEALEEDVFRLDGLLQDIESSCNMSEMGRRKFRDIAIISGLMFRGYPGRLQRDRHLQSSASLFFDVFSDYDKNNLLLQQSYEEVLYHELDTSRIRDALQRIQEQEIVLVNLEEISPFGFPIMVDRLGRERLSNERLEDRVSRILKGLNEGN